MKILIHGDSWGCGEWSDNSINNHRGTELFLTLKGHDVENYSVGGNSNNSVYETLAKKDLKKYDFIFVFFTNPFRDLLNLPNKTKHLDVPDHSITYEKYVKIYEDLVLSYYNNLDSLNHPIYLIGGHNKVDSSLLNHKNLINFIPSLREMFYPEFQEEQIIYWGLHLGRYLSKFDENCIEKLYQSKVYMSNLNVKHPEYFYPDGYHLNVKGHRILSDYIHTFILNSNSR